MRRRLKEGFYHELARNDVERISQIRNLPNDPDRFGKQDLTLKPAFEAEIAALKACGLDHELIDAEVWCLQFTYDYGFYLPGHSPLLRRKPGYVVKVVKVPVQGAMDFRTIPYLSPGAESLN